MFTLKDQEKLKKNCGTGGRLKFLKYWREKKYIEIFTVLNLKNFDL